MGTALQAVPDTGLETLKRARACYEEALPVLNANGRPQECAEAQLNLGLVLQSLAGSGAARLQDAVQCYHRALRVFTREAFAQEYAILHNNLAIAYLSIPLSDERGRMREALAVQSFEEVLKVINLADHPSEFAMIQNNLGNALQYAASGHPLQNNLRALAAYDEALKVRNERDTPLEYANTICNKANVLRNLPDDLDDPSRGRHAGLTQARDLYRAARGIFERFHQTGGTGVVDEALLEIETELAQQPRLRGNGDGRDHAV
jgi:tetratricopeptide (TPR) repeat protein